jgi:formylglycine-generating enzyme required for sulfatase activity
MDFATSFAASSFRKVLKGFEIGGLPYEDVQFHLKRLLAAGTSPDELQEVLRRCELITPLPEYAHADVLLVIEEAKERAAAMAAEQPPDIEIDLGESESTLDPDAEMEMMRGALETEQAKSRDMGRALADRIASEQASRARSEEARREAEQLQAELRTMRHSISDRDAVIAQMRLSLNESNAQLDASQRSYAESKASLDSRAKSASQIQAELDASRAAADRLQRELQQRAAEMAALRESLAGREKSLAEMQRAVADRDSKLPEFQSARKRLETLEPELKAAKDAASNLQRAIAERDAKLASLRQEHERGQSELLGARRRVDALERELNAAREAATPLRKERDSLRTQLSGLQSKLRDSESLIATLQQSVRSDARRVAELQAAAAPPASQAARAVPVLQIAELAPPKAAPRWKPGTRARFAAAGAAIVVLAVMVWAYSRHGTAPAILPAAVTAAPQAGAVIKDCPECPSLTVLPAGRFQQGPAAAAAGASFEKPAHAVAIASAFAMSTNAVTVDEFRAFASATGRNMQGCEVYDGDWRRKPDSNWENPGFAQGGSHPVTCASWNDAKAYAAWLSAKTGHHYRLPSASEWEYAARSGTAAVLPWADAAGACAGANVADQSAARRFPGWTVFTCDDGYVFTAPVGTFKANKFGLNDMLGNVFQWTEDCWHPDYSDAPADGSARADGDCSERELRGGSWFSTPAYVRANYRNHFAADYRTSSVGIRLVRDLDS